MSFQKTYNQIINDMYDSLSSGENSLNYYREEWKNYYRKIPIMLYKKYNRFSFNVSFPKGVLVHEYDLKIFDIFESRHIIKSTSQIIYCGIAYMALNDEYIYKTTVDYCKDLQKVKYCFEHIQSTLNDSYREAASILNCIDILWKKDNVDHKMLIKSGYRFSQAFFCCTDKKTYRNIDYYVSEIGSQVTTTIQQIDKEYHCGFFETD